MTRFVKLGDALKKELSTGVVLPERPSKEVKFFNSTKFDNKYLRCRQHELQKWMRALVSIPAVLSSYTFRKFVGTVHPEHSEGYHEQKPVHFGDQCRQSAAELFRGP